MLSPAPRRKHACPRADKLKQMNVSEETRAVQQIHASGRQLVIALTGGGSGAISTLLQVPGASASILEAIVPYAAQSLHDWLGGPVDQYCSEATARAMAM